MPARAECHVTVPSSATARALHSLQDLEAGTVATAIDDVIVTVEPSRDLAPSIHRQRLVIEGTCTAPITDQAIRTYLTQLSDVCGMTTLIEPVTHRSDRYGWAGWIHWETSGAHFYAWESPLFFSIDIYTCKAFDAVEAVRFTRDFFDATDIVARSV
jgi:S-adenosylmethionine/arginine decarboxylase-like enzyme